MPRSPRLALTATLACALGACGDDESAHPDAAAPDAARPDAAAPDAALDIADQLAALPGVTVTELTPTHAPAGYRYFQLQVTQPVDHAVPSGATFTQEVSLLHRDATAPMIAATTGYDDYIHDRAAEPTRLLAANQISIEHRFFGTSRPDPADWSTLTVRQAADDEHAIIALLSGIYHGPWVTTGASKGGMTAVFHRRFYPDDVAGTLAYVAPLSLAIPDARYAPFLDDVGTPACRDAVRAIAREMLENRRAALVALAQDQADTTGLVYTRIALGPAVEAAIADLEWTFWQHYGLAACPAVPATNATDQDLFDFLDLVSPVGFSADGDTAAYEAYFYQAYAQLGSPGPVSVRGDSPPAQLAALRQYTEDDYVGTLPLGEPVPVHDPAIMADIDQWVRTAGHRLVFVYGQWDPWTAGAFQLGAATESLAAVVAQGTHGSRVMDLDLADRTAVFAALATWTGVTPTPSAARRAPTPPLSRATREAARLP